MLHTLSRLSKVSCCGLVPIVTHVLTGVTAVIGKILHSLKKTRMKNPQIPREIMASQTARHIYESQNFSSFGRFATSRRRYRGSHARSLRSSQPLAPLGKYTLSEVMHICAMCKKLPSNTRRQLHKHGARDGTCFRRKCPRSPSAPSSYRSTLP